jgi:hypothetical protein
MPGMQATNAVASFLVYLPFKLSMIFRFAMHHRRDGMPLLTIGAWFAAMTVVLGATLSPIIGAAALRGSVDAVFVAIAAGGCVLAYGAILLISGYFQGSRGIARIHHVADFTRIGLVSRLVRSAPFHHLHHGFAMLASPGTLAGAMASRIAHTLLIALRLKLAAMIVGVDVGWSHAFLYAVLHFIIGVVSPAGSVGTREGGLAGLAAMIETGDSSGFQVVALLVLASESAVTAVAAVAGLIYLRPDRLMKSGPAASEPAEPTPVL